MKSMYLALASLLLAVPALAGESTVPEPGGIGAVAGVVAALLALKALRK